MNPERTIIVCGLAAGGIRLVGRFVAVGRSPEHMRTVIGTFLLIALLLLIAEFAPDMAKGIAIVVLTTSVVMNGEPFLKIVGKLAD
jgi:hypothetical protein